MNPLLLVLSAILVIAQFALPRRLAFLPLLIAACHTPYHAALADQFTAVRLVILAGLVRAGGTGQLNWSRQKPLDLVLAIWSVLALFSAIGHTTGNPFIYRCGLVLNVLGTYLYARAYVRTPVDFEALIRSLAVVLVPLAALLALEAITGANAYFAVGAKFAEALTREERTRAMGPFGTPILAGTLGAVCFPLFIAIWRTAPKVAKIGVAASLTIVVASASSGPIGSLLLGSGALALWRWRSSLTKIKIALVVMLTVVQLCRARSIWYLISLIDFVGGSTGWHRSRLLDSATEHLNEWWLFGTDYTRHWMPYGLRSIPNHCDLTSYYVHLGVIGGLPLLIALIFILWRSFRALGRGLQKLRATESPQEFLLWCVGCDLFAHAVTFFTISYFDQLFVFFYIVVAAVPALVTSAVKVPEPQRVTAHQPQVLTVTHCQAALIRVASSPR